MNLNHKEIWQALDRLAEKKGLSVSGLAIKAGLDPTTFNKSRRMAPGGRPRWPSTESVNKVLEVTGTSAHDFIKLAYDNESMVPVVTIPLIGMAQAGRNGFFDEMGSPLAANDWDGIEFPGSLEEGTYALEVSGESMEPTYRDGDRLIVSPHAVVRKGDRVVVKTRKGEVMVKELSRQTALQIELKSLNRAHKDCIFETKDISWIARVLWVSQ